jgi:hypothetical protein
MVENPSSRNQKKESSWKYTNAPKKPSQGPLDQGNPFIKGKMIFLSFNTRRVGGAPKKLALKILFLSLKLDIILIQEIMCSSDKAREIFTPWLRNWSFITIKASGLS